MLSPLECVRMHKAIYLIEMQWYLFSIIFLLGASYTYQKDKHIRVDVFYNKFSANKKRKFNMLGTLFLMLPFCSMLLYISSLYFYTSFQMREQSSEPNGIPRYYIKFFIPFSFLVLLKHAISKLIQLIKNESYDT